MAGWLELSQFPRFVNETALAEGRPADARFKNNFGNYGATSRRLIYLSKRASERAPNYSRRAYTANSSYTLKEALLKRLRFTSVYPQNSL